MTTPISVSSISTSEDWKNHETFLAAKRLAIQCRKDFPPNMLKYWNARHDLFSLFSEGILLDEESWFSVTPEAIAYRIATQCACGVILDAFCGAGGNAIQFAMTCEHVVAIDIDPIKLALARNNAAIYGVEDRITFLCGDFCEFARAYGENKGHTSKVWQGWDQKKFDIVFMSPPWGGVNYQRPTFAGQDHAQYQDIYPLSKLHPVHGKELFRLAQAICERTVMYLPRNVDLEEVAQLVKVSPNTQLTVHAEELWLGYKLKALAVYFSGAQW